MSDPEKRTPMGTIDFKYKSRFYQYRAGRRELTVISTLSSPSIRLVVARSMRVPIACHQRYSRKERDNELHIRGDMSFCHQSFSHENPRPVDVHKDWLCYSAKLDA